ncbi:hypothetical protein Csa_021540 [Cucumis sativus]|nr:hypothetical protein Csa_021540 [Cucumis sativus]
MIDEVPTSLILFGHLSRNILCASLVPEKRIMAPQNRDIQQQHVSCMRETTMPASFSAQL